MNSFSERAERERQQYNEGLQRKSYNAALSHTGYFYELYGSKVLEGELQYANGRRILELGSHCWIKWIERNGIKPDSIDCINISERELQKGVDAAEGASVKPCFTLMDANHLQYDDETFDLVFGSSILHHLDYVNALDEIYRVLKPGGRMLFSEPLDNNPIGKLVRVLTPKARTDDEQPLRTRDIDEIRQRFDTTFFYSQFLSVPFGLVSKALFKRPDNLLMKAAFRADRLIDDKCPPIRKHYRRVIISGVKRGRLDS